MRIVDKDEFLKTRHHKNGVYVFTMKGECGLCEMYIETLTKKGIAWNVVNFEKEDTETLAKEHLITAFPITRVLFEGMTVFEKKGVLFDKQIKEVQETEGKYLV